MSLQRPVYTQIAALVLAVFLGGTCGAQITSFSVSGVVLLNERRPGDGATSIRVELTTERGGEGIRAVVTESGEYKFGGLKPGVYVVSARAPGFKPAASRVEINPVGQVRGSTTLDLVPENELPKINHEGEIISRNELRAPKQARGQLEKAEETLDSGDLSGAEEAIRRAFRIYPEYARAYWAEGRLREKQERWKEAREAYARAVDIDPDCYRAYHPLLELLRREGRHEEARRIGSQWGKLQPLLATPHYYVAIASYETGEYQAALDSAETAARLPHAQLPHLPLVLANCYLKLRNPAAAVTHLEEFLQASPEDPLASQARRTLEQIKALEVQ
jgi:tetratricopeptide (TPR) repeat protein